MNSKGYVAAALALTASLWLTGCQQEPEDKLEDAKQEMSDAVDSVGDAVESLFEVKDRHPYWMLPFIRLLL